MKHETITGSQSLFIYTKRKINNSNIRHRKNQDEGIELSPNKYCLYSIFS